MDFGKNSLIRQFVALCRGPMDREEPIRRILVVSTTAMGDTLWATPAIENLRRQFPEGYIAVLTSPIGQEILKNNPCIDRLILLKEPVLAHLFSLIKTVRKEKFDAALIFHASQRLTLPLCSLSRIPRIIGTKGINKGLDDLLTDAIEYEYEHEIVRRQKIIARIHAAPLVQTLSYYVDPSEQQKARDTIGKKEKPFIAIHPGAKEKFRRWPASCFATVARALQEKWGCEIFLTGSSSEKKLLQKIQQMVPDARIVSSPSIRFLGAFLQQMDLVLSNDTGPFHLACALHRPAVGIYVSTDPSLCGPHVNSQAIAVSRKPTCAPCIKRQCRDPFCFLQISPQEVIEACSKMLR